LNRFDLGTSSLWGSRGLGTLHDFLVFVLFQKDQWESESEDEEPPQNYTEDKPVAKPVAEPISEPEEPKPVVERKKVIICLHCLLLIIQKNISISRESF
jgi:hypothetical protein